MKKNHTETGNEKLPGWERLQSNSVVTVATEKVKFHQ